MVSVSEQSRRAIEFQCPNSLGRNSTRLRSALLLLLLALLGCTSRGDELVSEVNGKQSIEVIVALSRAGIPAERSRTVGRGERYSVTVAPADYSRAMQVLHDFQLPSKDEETLEELTAPKGFVPNSREVSGLRLDHALALEVERLIAGLPGVSDARVVIRSNLAVEGSAKASVVVRFLSPSGATPFDIDSVKKLVAQTVPGIAMEAIEVVPSRLIIPGMAESSALEGTGTRSEIVPLSPFLPFLFRVSSGDRERALWQLGAMLVMFSCAGGIIGAYFGIRVMRGSGRKRAGKGEKRNSFFLEASVKADSKSGGTIALPKGQVPPIGKDLTKPGS